MLGFLSVLEIWLYDSQIKGKNTYVFTSSPKIFPTENPSEINIYESE